MRIKKQLLLTHGLLVILSLLIVLINAFSFKSIDNDASIINESGKLRAYSYNMAQLLNQSQSSDYIDHGSCLVRLEKRVEDFDRILIDLNDKENTSSMVMNHREFVVKLNSIISKWENIFKPVYINVINQESTKASRLMINSDVDDYVDEINEMVTAYSAYAKYKIIRALWVNGGLILLIIIITGYSFKTTNSRIQKPMKHLLKELKEISLIDEGLSEKIRNIHTDEISEMTSYFNEMMYDQLTNTFNRRSGLAKLNSMLQHKKRRQLELSLCFIDINGLKIVNDQLNHKYGDELIVSVVEGIEKEIREKDFIIRMGGDEFLIAFNDVNKDISEKVWMRINDRFDRINQEENRPYIISVSHGIVQYDNFEKSEVELLIKDADEKMYAEKRKIKQASDFKIIKDN